MNFPNEVPALCRIRLNHMIAISTHGMLRLESHGRESETQLFSGNASQGRSIPLVHQAEYFGSSEPVTLFLRFRTTETSMKDIFQWRLAIVCLITTLHFLFFLLIQIIPFSIQHLLLQLGIKLFCVLSGLPKSYRSLPHRGIVGYP